jgi:hypothetical protein
MKSLFQNPSGTIAQKGGSAEAESVETAAADRMVTFASLRLSGPFSSINKHVHLSGVCDF